MRILEFLEGGNVKFKEIKILFTLCLYSRFIGRIHSNMHFSGRQDTTVMMVVVGMVVIIVMGVSVVMVVVTVEMAVIVEMVMAVMVL